MSTSALPVGAFFTTINGKRCTAIPRSTTSSAAARVTTSSVAVASPIAETTPAPAVPVISSSSSSISTTSSSLPEPIANTPSSVELTTLQSTTEAQTSVAVAPPVVVTPSTSSTPDAVPATPASTPASADPSSTPIPPTSASDALTSTSLVATSASLLPMPSSSTTNSPAQESILASVAPSSDADTSVTIASAADAQPNSQAPTALPDIVTTPSPVAAESTTASNQIFITIGTASTTGDIGAAPAATDPSSSTNGAAGAVSGSTSNSVQSTVAVAGGVIGGVIAISMLAFLIWWWRRRTLKKRRSTLLTPLTIDPSFGEDEKAPYVIKRGSIGPTPRAEKFKAALDYKISRIHGRVSQLFGGNGAKSPSVNMNRGNSQFMEVSTHSRVNSLALRSEPTVTTKDRLVDWWSRLTADMSFNWRIRNDMAPVTDAFGRSLKQKGGPGPGSQPDFLTLMRMDDSELDREAQRRRVSIGRRNASAGSTDHFLGGLNLNFDDPFSDANSSSHESAKPAPLVVSQINNPFIDANAIRDPPPAAPKPTTYVADIRRSRGQSVSDSSSRAPSTVYGRESMISVESFSTRRNKFRSDPFDLERPELLGRSANDSSSSLGSTAGSSPLGGAVVSGQIRPPVGAHTRTDSFTSKYSSGMSLGDWSDPGPDVGPAEAQWNGPEPRESPTQGWRDRQEKESAQKLGRTRSGASQISTGVGKAM